MASYPPAVRSRVSVQLLTTTWELQALEPEWNALLQRSRSNSLFLTWEWISTWWQVYGDRGALYVLAARNTEGTLVGLAPVYRVRRRLFGFWGVDALEFIGSGCDVTPEYLDVVADPAFEADVVDAFAELVCHDDSLSGLDLRPLAGHSPHLDRLASHLSQGRGSVRCMPASICPTLNLPPTRDGFMASRSRNYRKKMGEYERRAARELGIGLRVTASGADLQRDMSALIDLHARRWRGGSRAFRSTRYVEFQERLARLLLDRGWLRLFLLESGSKPLAALYCFSYGGRFSFYQAGRDPRFDQNRLGLVLMHRVIQEAIDEGASVFDFLSGEESYKYRWADGQAQNFRVEYWKSAPARIGVGRPATWSSLLGARPAATRAHGPVGTS